MRRDLHGDASMLCPIQGDRHRLIQALGNVIDNPAKFTPAGGRVDVPVSQFTDRAVVTATDAGCGTGVGEQQRVFERLCRGCETAPSEAPGTGLGLALGDETLDANRSVSLQIVTGDGPTEAMRLPLGYRSIESLKKCRRSNIQFGDQMPSDAGALPVL